MAFTHKKSTTRTFLSPQTAADDLIQSDYSAIVPVGEKRKEKQQQPISVVYDSCKHVDLEEAQR